MSQAHVTRTSSRILTLVDRSLSSVFQDNLMTLEANIVSTMGTAKTVEGMWSKKGANY